MTNRCAKCLSFYEGRTCNICKTVPTVASPTSNAGHNRAGRPQASARNAQRAFHTSMSGFTLLAAAAATFGICSIVQAACGSSMFSISYVAEGFAKVILINATFYPGWLLTILLGVRGLRQILGHRDADDAAMGFTAPRPAPAALPRSSPLGHDSGKRRPIGNETGTLPALDEVWSTFLGQYAEGTVDAQELWDAVDNFGAGHGLGWLRNRRRKDRLERAEAELVQAQADEVALLLRRYLAGQIDGDELASSAMETLGLD